MFGLDAGTLEQKGQLLEAFLEQWGAKQEGGCHVATFPRRDIPTSRRWVNNAKVNNQKRRDVPMSRRLNVAMLQRRDVSTGSALHHLKHEWLGMKGIGRCTNEGREFQSRVTQTSKKCP